MSVAALASPVRVAGATTSILPAATSPTLCDLDAVLSARADAGTVARVVLESLMLARRTRPNAEFWIGVAYRGLSKWDRPACNTIRSLRRQVLDAEDELLKASRPAPMLQAAE